MTTTYRVENHHSGVTLGHWDADSPRAAIEAYCRDAGYSSLEDALEVTSDTLETSGLRAVAMATTTTDAARFESLFSAAIETMAEVLYVGTGRMQVLAFNLLAVLDDVARRVDVDDAAGNDVWADLVRFGFAEVTRHERFHSYELTEWGLRVGERLARYELDKGGA